MSNKDKWKDFPCKTCLLKGKCFNMCFMWPHVDLISIHVEENDLKHTCLSCGNRDEDINYIQLYCIKCNPNWLD